MGRFKRIKLKIMNGRKLSPFRTAEVIQDHEDRLTALETGQPVVNVMSYSFNTYSDSEGETELDSGTVETTGVENNGYTQIEVKTSTSDESIVGNKFYIISTASKGTIYELFTDAGNTSANIYIKLK